jgi:hypothetical protein
MATFPTRRNDLLALAINILEGITANRGAYPVTKFDTTALTAGISSAQGATTTRQQQESALAVSVDGERESYDVLSEIVRSHLDQAEDAHRNALENLTLIGWEPQAAPTKRVPQQPRALEAQLRGAGSVFLDWKAPLDNRGSGKAAFYRVERQVRTLEGEVTETWGAWSSSAVPSELLLTGQPRSVELDYRIVAVNATGDSLPSNTITVTL